MLTINRSNSNSKTAAFVAPPRILLPDRCSLSSSTGLRRSLVSNRFVKESATSTREKSRNGRCLTIVFLIEIKLKNCRLLSRLLCLKNLNYTRNKAKSLCNCPLITPMPLHGVTKLVLPTQPTSTLSSFQSTEREERSSSSLTTSSPRKLERATECFNYI